MLTYRNCHAIRTGVTMPTHTLKTDIGNISIAHENNLNYGHISKNPDYMPFATAFDTEGNKYTLYQGKAGIMAVIDEYINPLTVQEMIVKYNLQMTVDEYKKLFNIK